MSIYYYHHLLQQQQQQQQHKRAADARPPRSNAFKCLESVYLSHLATVATVRSATQQARDRREQTLPVLAAAQRTRLSRLPERGRRVVRERFKRYLFLRWLFFFIY